MIARRAKKRATKSARDTTAALVKLLELLDGATQRLRGPGDNGCERVHFKQPSGLLVLSTDMPEVAKLIEESISYRYNILALLNGAARARNALARARAEVRNLKRKPAEKV